MRAPTKATFLVVEDGDEYIRRFERFLGARFAFVRAGCFREVGHCLAQTPSCAGLLLDLDFRRTPPAELVDEAGRLLGAGALPTEAGTGSALHGVQGILILRALRQHGVCLPAWLFADLPDGEQVTFLETSLAPLRVLSSAVGLPGLAALLTAASPTR